MVTTSPLVTGVFGAGDWRVIVPCGCVLLAAGCSFSETPLADAHDCAAACCWPTKLGSGGPALTTIRTGSGCGCEAPVPGVVLITMPTAIVADTWFVTAPGVSPAFRSAACACASVRPLTCGTPISFGPADGISSIVAPLRTRDEVAGTVAITSPLATLLSSWAVPVRTVKPMPRSSDPAAATLSPPTPGTRVYRPSVCHQTSPAARAATTITASAQASLRLNSQRCSRGSRSPGSGGPPDCTMRVWLPVG